MTLPDLRPASPTDLAVIGAIIWVVGALLHFAVLPPVGLALLLLAAVGWLVRPRSRTTYWRGRPIELVDNEPTLGHRFYRVLFRR